jgi:hypothetical protein
MEMRSLLGALACGVACIVAAEPCFAQQVQPPDAQSLREEVERLRLELDTLRERYESQLAALAAKVGALEASQSPPVQQAQTPAGAVEAGGAQGTLPVYGAAAAASKIFNPDIAVIGDFLGVAGRNDVHPSKAFEMHESEASFQAVVDPYARADFFISFGEEGVDLEEGYLTLTSLPGGLLTRVGKMRAAFGKVNLLHNHVAPWADRPLVINNLLAGEEGISDAGISVARLVPNPWLFLEATGQVFRGDSGTDLFRATSPGEVSYVGHLRGYRDLSESSNIDLGASFSYGHNPAGLVNDTDLGGFTTRLYGIDATVRWRPLRRAIYRSFVGRTEAIWSRRDQFGGPEHATGYFVSGDYQFARRWFGGLRYDWSEHADNAALIDRGESLLLTYWPSEFSQVRGQYRRTAYAGGTEANEFLFQFQFSIGVHGAHPF